MSLRSRLTLWYGAMLIACVCIALLPSYDELIIDAPQYTQQEPKEGWNRFHAILIDMIIDASPIVAFGIIGGWFITGRALRPLERIIEAAEKLNENTLGNRITNDKCDIEIARLTHVFNNMSERLECSFLRVRDFTLHASHELKTPLAVMRGDMESCLRYWDHLSIDELAKLAGQIDEIDRLTRIVDGLFLLVKADAGLFDMSKEALHFEELVDDAVEAMEILGATNEISVTFSERVTCVVLGDRPRLRQLMLNLADNSIKYNEPKGWVNITLRCEANELVLIVANSGLGIGKEDQKRVFERFYRGPSDRENIEGCGLGLSIVQWIVQAHHGKIVFRSQPGNTEVEIRFPLHFSEDENDSIVIPVASIPLSG
jgi:signal transduction histidine kinase